MDSVFGGTVVHWVLSVWFKMLQIRVLSTGASRHQTREARSQNTLCVLLEFRFYSGGKEPPLKEINQASILSSCEFQKACSSRCLGIMGGTILKQEHKLKLCCSNSDKKLGGPEVSAEVGRYGKDSRNIQKAFLKHVEVK